MLPIALFFIRIVAFASAIVSIPLALLSFTPLTLYAPFAFLAAGFGVFGLLLAIASLAEDTRKIREAIAQDRQAVRSWVDPPEPLG